MIVAEIQDSQVSQACKGGTQVSYQFILGEHQAVNVAFSNANSVPSIWITAYYEPADLVTPRSLGAASITEEFY